MSFNSLFFILFFLPVSVGLYYILPKRAENAYLLGINLLFYMFCDELFVLLLILSGLINYFFGKLNYSQKNKSFLFLSILLNLSFLGFFKYFNFALSDSLIIPLGISFFTFRAISYQVDLYRRKTEPAESLLTFMTYFTLFPLITAGPIVRYTDMHEQLRNRSVTPTGFIRALERFVLGLMKKVLIAGTFAGIADRVFAAPPDELSMSFAWIGILAYTFQIFFDFSGYTDMAIGIGGMLGFRFTENFNFPYMAKNIRDFWQRWHITLSSWLRDYLFLPLAYFVSNSLKKERYLMIKTDRIIYFIAISITFFICGFWHGTGLTFIFWGLYYALFLILEQFGARRLLKRTWPFFQHLYTLFVVIIGWVIFRSDTMNMAIKYISRMFSFSSGWSPLNSELAFYIGNTETLFVTLMAILLSLPVGQWLNKAIKNKISDNSMGYYIIITSKILFLILIFIVSLSYISANTYQPFIYKQF